MCPEMVMVKTRLNSINFAFAPIIKIINWKEDMFQETDQQDG